jgi:hypothetical protein
VNDFSEVVSRISRKKAGIPGRCQRGVRETDREGL